MPGKRYCSRCGLEVVPRRERSPIEGTVKSATRLVCPNCSRLLASVYDEDLQLEPVKGAKIAKY